MDADVAFTKRILQDENFSYGVESVVVKKLFVPREMEGLENQV